MVSLFVSYYPCVSSALRENREPRHNGERRTECNDSQAKRRLSPAEVPGSVWLPPGCSRVKVIPALLLFAPPFGIGFYAACAISKVSPDKAIGHMWRYLFTLIVAAVPWFSIALL